MAVIGTSPFRGLAKIRVKTAVAGNNRNFTLSLVDVAPNSTGDEVDQNGTGATAWEQTPSTTGITLRLEWDSEGAAPPAQATIARVSIRIPDGAQIGATTWSPAVAGDSGSATRTFHFDSDPLDEAANSLRWGMFELFFEVEKVGGVDAWGPATSRGAFTNPGVLTSDHAQGYLRGTATLSNHTVSNASLGGAEPSTFAYPDSIFLQALLNSVTATENFTLTARIRDSGADVRTKATTGTSPTVDFSLTATAEKVDATFDADTDDLRYELTAASFGGDNKFAWAGSGHQSGWTRTSELILDRSARIPVNPNVTLGTPTNTGPSGVNTVYNRGETSGGTITVQNARSEAITPRGTETLTSIDTGGGVENSISFSKASFTYTYTSVFAAAGNVAPATTAGSAKKIRWRDSAANSPAPADSSTYSFLSSLYDLAIHLQNNSNTLTPASNTNARLTSDLGFFSCKITNRRAQAVNGATGTLALQDDASLVTAITSNGTTAAVNGHDGYLALKAWDSSLPGGGWDLWADGTGSSVAFTKDGNTGSKARGGAGTYDFTLLAPNPNVAVVVAAGPSPENGDHWHPGESLLVGGGIYNTSTKTLLTPDASPVPFSIISRFSAAGAVEYFDTDFTWKTVGAGAVGSHNMVTADTILPGADSRIYLLSFTAGQTVNFTLGITIVVSVFYVSGTPYRFSYALGSYASANKHVGYAIDVLGLAAKIPTR